MRVMVVEDHWLWADALTFQLQSIGGVSVAGVAATAESAYELARATRPDLALVDVILGDESGLQVARVLRARHPSLKVVIITSDPSAWTVEQARQCGVSGLVAKNDLRSRDDVRAVVQRSLAAIEFFSSSGPRPGDESVTKPHGLTTLELQIIRGLDRGLGTAEIARELLVAQQTVRNRVGSIGKKLRVSGRIEIRARAEELGLLGQPVR